MEASLFLQSAATMGVAMAPILELRGAIPFGLALGLPTELVFLVAVIGTLLMALYAKMPFAQACGMGLNSFFFVSFIIPALISDGDGNVIGFTQALTTNFGAGLVIILLSGIIFLLLSVTGLRSYIATRILVQNGFDAFNFVGGYRLYSSIYSDK